jgi:hypothetical protein
MMAGARFLALIMISIAFSPGLNRVAAEVIDQGRCYDAGGGEIACAGTGQDGDIQAGSAWPDPRFTDNGDGTLTDGLTGLVWLKDAGCLGTANQSGARDLVAELNRRVAAPACAGYGVDHDDWRLPEVRELESLTNLAAPNQAEWLAGAGFVNVGAAGYWSATPAASAYNCWLVELSAGGVDYAPTTSSHGVWPVRRTEAPKPPRKKDAPPEPPLPRFVANGNGTVADRETGLLWLQDAGAHPDLTWSEALALVGALEGGRGEGAAGWRLPNRRELQSLLDYRRDYPALPPEAPFTELRSSYYWTASTSAASPAYAWTVHPLYGDTRPRDKSGKAALWPVRTEPAAAGRLPHTAAWLQKKKDPAAETRLAREAIGISLPRFIPHADGTVTDNLTGLMWLADGDCFGKVSWPKAQEAVALFNSERNPFSCDGYTASYRDWRLPGSEQLRELRPPTETDAIAWLNEHGFKDMQAHGYWTGSDSMSNIYYAWLFNLRVGEKRKYPKNLRYYAIPYRLP